MLQVGTRDNSQNYWRELSPDNSRRFQALIVAHLLAAVLSLSITSDRLSVNRILGEYDVGDSRDDAVLPFFWKAVVLGQSLHRRGKHLAKGKLFSIATSALSWLGDVVVDTLVRLCSLERYTREGTEALDESVDGFAPKLRCGVGPALQPSSKIFGCIAKQRFWS